MASWAIDSEPIRSRGITLLLIIFFKTMYNKSIIRFGFSDVLNNQGLGKFYQPQPSALADNTYLDLDYSGYHKNLIQ